MRQPRETWIPATVMAGVALIAWVGVPRVDASRSAAEWVAGATEAGARSALLVVTSDRPATVVQAKRGDAAAPLAAASSAAPDLRPALPRGGWVVTVPHQGAGDPLADDLAGRGPPSLVSR